MKKLLRDIPTPTEWLLCITYEQTLSPVLWQHEIENWTWRKVKLQHTEVFEWFTTSVVSRSIQCQQLFWRLGCFLPYSIFPDWNPGINQRTSGQYSAEGAAIGFPINLSLCLVKCHSAPFASIHPEHRRAGSCARPPFRLHFLSKFETIAKFMFVPLQVCGGPPLASSPHPPPSTPPGADRCASPPSRPQCWESDNIRSILFPVTHSPRPTVKWKRLLEAVNGDWREVGHSGHLSVYVCVCPCVSVFLCVFAMHMTDPCVFAREHVCACA